jgi:hypothetical protein
MTKLAATGLAVGVVAVGLAAAMQWRDLRGEQAQGAQLRERVSALEAAQLAAAGNPPPATLPVAGMPQPAPAAVPVASTAGPAPDPQPSASAASGAQPPTTMAQALSDPRTLEMTRAVMRNMLPQQYPDIAKDLNLSATEVEKLFDTLARQQMDAGTGGALDLFAGGELNAAAIQEAQRKMQQQQKAHDAELAALLGSRYPLWQDYQGTASARSQVDQLQAALGPDNRLSDAARKSVITALAVEEGRIQRDEREVMLQGRNTQEFFENQINRATELNQRRIAAASPLLTVAQRDTYRRMLEQQTSMAAMMLRSMSAPAGSTP